MRIVSLILIVCGCLVNLGAAAQNSSKPRMGVTVISDSLASTDLLAADTVKPLANKSSGLVSDTVSIKDSIVALPFITPKKKAMFAAILPGMGQIYNKQYWKLPIVYGALGFGAYQIYHKNDRYNYYRRIYAGRLSNKQEFIDLEANIPNDGIKYYQDAFRQERDLAALLTVLGYGLQIMDALVFAHLKNFDITEDITMQVKPSYIPNVYSTSPTVGIGMVFQLKK